MSAPKHTPGPWGVQPDGSPGEFMIHSTRGPADKLAHTYGPLRSKANAHLISAAPEMYKALDELAAFLYEALDALAAFVEEAVGADVLNADEFSDNGLLELARRALAKARGEAKP